MGEAHEGKRRVESLWPVHQITWQKSRYVYDMYYVHGMIEQSVYDYCIRLVIIRKFVVPI
jgi:bud site selection protein 31